MSEKNPLRACILFACTSLLSRTLRIQQAEATIFFGLTCLAPNMQQSQPSQMTSIPPPPPPMVMPQSAKGGGSGLSKALSGAALALAIVALIVNFVVPGSPGPAGPAGPAGSDGARGLQGPPGNGTLLASSSKDTTATIEASCTNYLQVTITVPSSGTVVVWTQAWLAVDHTAGTRDLMNLQTSTVPTGCGIGPYSAAVDIPASDPTASAFHMISLQRPFAVAPGANTFYFNAIMQSGQNANDMFSSANMVAVFYPS